MGYIAGTKYRAKLTVLHVLSPEARGIVEGLHLEHTDIQQPIRKLFEGIGHVPCELTILYGPAAEQILTFARERKCDRIVFAIRRRHTLWERFTSSIGYQILCGATSPILSVREGTAMNPFQTMEELHLNGIGEPPQVQYRRNSFGRRIPAAPASSSTLMGTASIAGSSLGVLILTSVRVGSMGFPAKALIRAAGNQQWLAVAPNDARVAQQAHPMRTEVLVGDAHIVGRPSHASNCCEIYPTHDRPWLRSVMASNKDEQRFRSRKPLRR